MENIRVFCFLASYLVVLLIEVYRLRQRSHLSRLFQLLFAGAGLVAHTLYLLHRSREANLPPLLSSSHDWLLVLAWLLAVIYVFLACIDRKLTIGIFMLPIVLIMTIVAYAVSRSPHAMIPQVAVRNAIRSWGMLHAGLLALGTVGVVIGFLLGLMYLLQHRRLKQQRVFWSRLNLPSLATLARWNWWSVILSVPLLTLGLATGIVLGVLANRGDAEAFRFSDPQVIISGVAWLVMFVFFIWLLTGRRETGKQVASLTLWAFGFLLVTVFTLMLAAGELMGVNSFHSALPPLPARPRVFAGTVAGPGPFDRSAGAFVCTETVEARNA